MKKIIVNLLKKYFFRLFFFIENKNNRAERDKNKSGKKGPVIINKGTKDTNIGKSFLVIQN